MYFPHRFAFLIVLLAGACKAVGVPPDALKPEPPTQGGGLTIPAYQQAAVARLGPGTTCTLNAAGTMALCLQLPPAGGRIQGPAVNCLVLLVKNNAILFEDRLANAQVEWFNNTQLRIYPYPGIVPGIPDARPRYYLFDLETKQKLSPPAERL
jgi:hypothetical protein